MKNKHRPIANLKTASVRLIAGQYRRRLVQFIDADGLRPTPDRVRETLFNWLADDLPNANVLDCCAGSGALGFEALSRGARQVSMIEPNREQLAQLRQTQATLQITAYQLQLYHGTAETQIPLLPTQVFDVVFIDPPYALDLWQPILQALTEHHLINQNTVLYIESNAEHETILGNWFAQLTPFKSKKMGQIFAGLYQWQTPS